MDEAELKALVREQLGRQALLVRSETRHLARALEPGEVALRVAMGVRSKEGLLVLLTDRRLLLGRGWSPLRRRERVEAHPLAGLLAVDRHMMSVEIEFRATGPVSLALAPEEPAQALVDELRADLGHPDAGAVREELQALAERKLGDRLTGDLASDLALLADGVEADEDVQRLAFVSRGRVPMLAALTDRRLILVHAALRGHNDVFTAWARADIAEVTRSEDTLRIIIPAGDGEHAHAHPVTFMDPARCDEFEAVLR